MHQGPSEILIQAVDRKLTPLWPNTSREGEKISAEKDWTGAVSAGAARGNCEEEGSNKADWSFRVILSVWVPECLRVPLLQQKLGRLRDHLRIFQESRIFFHVMYVVRGFSIWIKVPWKTHFNNTQLQKYIQFKGINLLNTTSLCAYIIRTFDHIWDVSVFQCLETKDVHICKG